MFLLHRRSLAPTWSLRLAVAALLLGASAADALTLGQVDDFETETAEGWSVGIGSVPVQTTGGPAGVGDAFLEPSASGGAGAGSRLVIFNTQQWAGDYTTEGVVAIGLDALYVSGSDVSLRIVLIGPTGSVASTVPIVVSPPSVWESLEFSLLPQDLTFLSGTGDVASVLADTTQVRILHSVGLPVIGTGGLPSGDSVVATIGLDNIVALPEPDATLQGLVGLLVLVPLALWRARAR